MAKIGSITVELHAVLEGIPVNIEDVKAAIEFLKTDRWIPVSERQPTADDADEFGVVLCCTDIGWQLINHYGIFNDFLTAGYDSLDGINYVAWRPLPKPYKQEESK